MVAAAMASEGLFIAGETNAESSGEAEFYCCLLVTRDRRGEAAVELFSNSTFSRFGDYSTASK